MIKVNDCKTLKLNKAQHTTMCIVHKGFRGIRAVSPASFWGGNLIGLKPAIPYEIIHSPLQLMSDFNLKPLFKGLFFSFNNSNIDEKNDECHIIKVDRNHFSMLLNNIHLSRFIYLHKKQLLIFFINLNFGAMKKIEFFLFVLFMTLVSCSKDEDENIINPVPTPGPTTVTDIDGNLYHTITIGTQVWMVENLKTSKYRNGDPIPNVNGESWDNLTAGAYCIYDNSEDYRLTYGHLYNWYAANDSRNICPIGWHIPTLEEWETLADTGLELKESGTTHWMDPNNCYPNNSGFKGLPGGGCGFDGSFNGITEYGYWWTASDDGTENGWMIMMDYQNAGLSGWTNFDKWIGASIRCIKD